MRQDGATWISKWLDITGRLNALRGSDFVQYNYHYESEGGFGDDGDFCSPHNGSDDDMPRESIEFRIGGLFGNVNDDEDEWEDEEEFATVTGILNLMKENLHISETVPLYPLHVTQLKMTNRHCDAAEKQTQSWNTFIDNAIENCGKLPKEVCPDCNSPLTKELPVVSLNGVSHT